MTEDHTFVIPAYGQSPHLPECIESILSQSRRSSRVLITTSTPSRYLEDIAAHYQIRLLVNPRRTGIAADWNFAMSACESGLVTIAHQDDLYNENYVETMSAAILRYPEALMAFSDFGEHTVHGPRAININLRIKRLLCARAFGQNEALQSPYSKRRLLTFGNPVCCPSVVINRRRLPDFRFLDTMKTNLDWEAWARMAHLPGEFVYVRKMLVSKRVHPHSETSVTIENQIRETEDRVMFEQFWPKSVAAVILAFYRLGYLANRV